MKITVFLLILLAAFNCIHSEPIKVIPNKSQASIGIVSDVKNLKRDQTEQTASADNKSQSNSQQYYQQDQKQYYQTGFSPISNNQVQQNGKSEGGVEYVKSGAPQYSEAYQNPISNYQTIAYSANHPSHAKLPSVVQLDQHQPQPQPQPQPQQFQYSYPAATNQHQYSIVPQQRHLIRQQLVSIPHPYRHPIHYPQAHLGYLTHVPLVPQQSYIYPTHAIQYSIVAPESENHQASTIAPSESPKSQTTTAAAVAPVQYVKYPIAHLANAQPKLIYSGHVPHPLHYHHQPAAYDIAVQPALQYIQPSKQYYSPVPAALQYKHILSGPIVNQNGGAPSYSKYSALPPVATTAASYTAAPVKPEYNIVFTTSSPPVAQHQQHSQHQQHPSDHVSGPSKTYTSPGGQEAAVYSHPGATYYGTHLYHPSIGHKSMSPPIQFAISKY